MNQLSEDPCPPRFNPADLKKPGALDKLSIKDLEEIMLHPSYIFRYAAGRALVRKGSPPAQDALIRVLTEDVRNEGDTIEQIRTIAGLLEPQPALITALENLLNTSDSWRIKAALLYALSLLQPGTTVKNVTTHFLKAEKPLEILEFADLWGAIISKEDYIQISEQLMKNHDEFSQELKLAAVIVNAYKYSDAIPQEILNLFVETNSSMVRLSALSFLSNLRIKLAQKEIEARFQEATNQLLENKEKPEYYLRLLRAYLRLNQNPTIPLIEKALPALHHHFETYYWLLLGYHGTKPVLDFIETSLKSSSITAEEKPNAEFAKNLLRIKLFNESPPEPSADVDSFHINVQTVRFSEMSPDHRQSVLGIIDSQLSTLYEQDFPKYDESIKALWEVAILDYDPRLRAQARGILYRHNLIHIPSGIF